MKDIKVFLFGSSSVWAIPQVVEDHLHKIVEQTGGNVRFLVGDCIGADAAFHMSLSRVGAAKLSTIYCMNFARNNKFKFETNVIPGVDSEGKPLVGRALYEVKDKQMIQDCDFAIALWDKNTKGTYSNINSLKARDKPVYVYTINV